MKTRLAQLIAEASKPDGKLDRVRLYESLFIRANDPVALIVESVLAVEENVAALRQEEGQFADRLKKMLDGESALRAAEAGAIRLEVDRASQLLKALDATVAQDAKLRAKWLTIAVVVPIVVCLVLLGAFWFLVKFKT